MKFSAVVLALATSVVALPNLGPRGEGPEAGKEDGKPDVKFPVPDDMTVKQAQTKCGDQAQLSCCNKATYAGDSNIISSGLLSGALSNLIGSGTGAEGLGLFDDCSNLPIIGDVVNQQCKQNIACCQNSPSSAVSALPFPLSNASSNNPVEQRSCRPWSSLRRPWLPPVNESQSKLVFLVTTSDHFATSTSSFGESKAIEGTKM